jgi:hypothetical protein
MPISAASHIYFTLRAAICHPKQTYASNHNKSLFLFETICQFSTQFLSTTNVSLKWFEDQNQNFAQQEMQNLMCPLY